MSNPGGGPSDIARWAPPPARGDRHARHPAALPADHALIQGPTCLQCRSRWHGDHIVVDEYRRTRYRSSRWSDREAVAPSCRSSLSYDFERSTRIAAHQSFSARGRVTGSIVGLPRRGATGVGAPQPLIKLGKIRHYERTRSKCRSNRSQMQLRNIRVPGGV